MWKNKPFENFLMMNVKCYPIAKRKPLILLYLNYVTVTKKYLFIFLYVLHDK